MLICPYMCKLEVTIEKEFWDEHIQMADILV